MFKRTKGEWYWDFSKDPETLGKPGIFVEGEGPLLHVQVGDLQLMANAPNMYELLHEVSDELDNVLSLKTITKGLPALAEKITALLQEINVEVERK